MNRINIMCLSAKLYDICAMIMSVFIVSSCMHSSDIDKELCKVIDVNNAQQTSVKFQGEIADVIALESCDGAMIQDVTSLFVTEKYIVVFDKGAQQVLQFDLKGKFVRNMSRQGRGPNELIEIREVVVSENLLYLYGLGRKLLIINMEGEVVRNVRLENSDFLSFYPDNNDLLWTYMYSDSKGNREHYLTVLNADMDIIACSGKKHPKALHIQSPQKYFFFNSNESLFFHHHLSDCIYYLDKKIASPIYRFDFGDNEGPNYAKISTLWRDSDISAELTNKTSVGDMVFIGDYLLFSYSKKKSDYATRNYGLFDTKENKTYVLSHSVELSFYLNKVHSEGTDFYRVIKPHWIKGKVLEEYEKRCGHKILEDDNPIIVIDKITDIIFSD